MKYLGIALFIIILALISDMDHKQELEDWRSYCEGVIEGSHPDYKGNFYEICSTEYIEKITGIEDAPWGY